MPMKVHAARLLDRTQAKDRGRPPGSARAAGRRPATRAHGRRLGPRIWGHMAPGDRRRQGPDPDAARPFVQCAGVGQERHSQPLGNQLAYGIDAVQFEPDPGPDLPFPQIVVGLSSAQHAAVVTDVGMRHQRLEGIGAVDIGRRHQPQGLLANDLLLHVLGGVELGVNEHRRVERPLLYPAVQVFGGPGLDVDLDVRMQCEPALERAAQQAVQGGGRGAQMQRTRRQLVVRGHGAQIACIVQNLLRLLQYSPAGDGGLHGAARPLDQLAAYRSIQGAQALLHRGRRQVFESRGLGDGTQPDHIDESLEKTKVHDQLPLGNMDFPYFNEG